MILYECFGLPGGGKTTSSHRANQTLGLPTTQDISTFWRLLSPSKKARIVLDSFLKEKSLWSNIIAFIVANKIIAPKSIIYLLKIPAQKILICRFLKDKSLLLDQWQLQNLWSSILNAHLTEVKHLQPLIAAIYKGISLHIFYYTVEPSEAAERVFERSHGQSRFDVMARHEIANALHDTAKHLETILAAAKSLPLPVTEIDGNDTLETTAERLVHACTR